MQAHPAPADAPIVEIGGLSHRFGDRIVLEVEALRIEPGQHLLVLGPSGSGKSTLLAVLAGLLRPGAGTVRIAGQDLATLGAAALDRFRGRTIGLVPQRLHLVTALTVGDNLRLARWLAGLPEDEAAVAARLDGLGLGDRTGSRPQELSQGEAQRVALARALITGPRLILADEPTSALDDRTTAVVLDLLIGKAESAGASLVIATHDARVRSRFRHELVLGDSR